MMRLPPYGKMGESYQQLMKEQIMPAWHPEWPDYRRHETFQAWKHAIAEDIATYLWPRYDRATGAWVGPAAAFAEEMSGIELDLMITRFQSGDGILADLPTSAGIVDKPRTHRWHYQQEDDLSTPLTVNYPDYDHTLSPAEIAELMTITQGIYKDKVQGVFSLKDVFLRPRPMQACVILGRHHFRSETCRSGVHPAMYCGHGMEAILFSATMLDHWISTGRPPSDVSRESLAQFSVDFGDRRVFAGVHYPSDNLAGWIMALQLIDVFFPEKPHIRSFAFDAIVHKSRVFKLILEEYPKHAALSGAVALMNRTFGMPAVPVA